MISSNEVNNMDKEVNNMDKEVNNMDNEVNNISKEIDNMDIKIDNEILKLEILRKEYYKEIKNIDYKIKKLIWKKYDNCIQKYGSHKVESYRENGPYGETFYYCKNCKYEF